MSLWVAEHIRPLSLWVADQLHDLGRCLTYWLALRSVTPEKQITFIYVSGYSMKIQQRKKELGYLEEP